jgi:hypothetical protein
MVYFHSFFFMLEADEIRLDNYVVSKQEIPDPSSTKNPILEGLKRKSECEPFILGVKNPDSSIG